MGHCNIRTSQAARDAKTSQDTLVDTFEHIEVFFQRLEIYSEVPPTPEMMDIIVKIMVEILTIFEIGIKDMKQGRLSK
jgi:hypothetical protein